MSTYVTPVFHKDYALYFEEYKEIPDLSSFLEQLVSLRQKNPGNLASTEFKEIFNFCLQACQNHQFRMGYRLLAFAAFSGINEYANFPGEIGTALLYAIHEEKSSLELIHELLIETLKERSHSINDVVNKIERIRRANLPSILSWIFSPLVYAYQNAPISFFSNTDENEIVKFNHGGGFQSIYHYFILRDWSGYEADSAIDGVWVTPYGSGYESRDHYYASRTPPKHFDTPCILTGEIQKKYLKKCPNSYEAKIDPNHVQHIKNISIQPIQSKQSQAYFPLLSYVSLEERLPSKYIQEFHSLFSNH